MLIGPPENPATSASTHNVAVNTMELLEQACAQAWPPIVDHRLGEWRLRAAGGFTGRANSALAIGDPGMPVPHALRQVCEFAHSHGIRPVAQAIDGSPTEHAIGAAGWVPNVGHAAGHEVAVLAGPLATTTAPGVTVLPAPNPHWWELTTGTTEPSEAQRHVLTGTAPAGYGVATVGARTVGAVRAALVGDQLHVARLEVRPPYRRRGLARALMGAAGAWARDRGATRCVLQVSVRNAPALALYRRLGLVEHHRYRYWVPAEGTCEDPTS
jgi:ribosomal protein S18 acetylase RimI-like enzyme